MTAVCVAGMHRSGTSMITRLVHMCGMSLGPSNDLLGAATDNPEGFWESRSLVLVNDAMLQIFGGGWDSPPAFDDQWINDPKLIPVRSEARRLLEVFNGETHWGWKDPRNSLTFPFWKQLVPDLKVLVCLRNPIEVAQSLTRRGHSSRNFGLQLWHAYNTAVLANTSPQDRVVTHYDSFFRNPEAELRRIVDALGMDVDDATIATACSTTKANLRHTTVGMEELLAAGPSAELVSTYVQLCNEAGPVYGSILESEIARLDAPLPEPSDTGTEWVDRWRTQRLEVAVATLAETAQQQDAYVQQLVRELSAKQLEMSQLQSKLMHLEKQQLKAS